MSSPYSDYRASPSITPLLTIATQFFELNLLRQGGEADADEEQYSKSNNLYGDPIAKVPCSHDPTSSSGGDW